MTTHRRLTRRATIVTAVLAVLIGAVSAFAFWSTTGTGAASATTGTLTAPRNIAATASGSTVFISWSAPTTVPSPSTYTLGYRVDRSGTTNAICSVSAPTTSCSDTAPSGTYSYTVTAVLGSWTASDTSPSVTVNAAPSSVVANTGTTPQSATVNTAFATTLSVTVKDSGGNPVSNVSVAFTAPPSGASGTFANGTRTTTATTNSSGVASASAFSANTTAGSYTVTATAGSVAANFSLTNNAGAAALVTATAGSGQSATVNTAFASALKATVTDTYGNVVSGATVSFTAPPSGASGTFPGGVRTDNETTNAAGVATSQTLTANATTGTYSVTAASGPGSTNFSLTNTAGSVSSVIANANTTPQSATVTTAFGTALSVTVKDAGNNPVSGATVTFTAPPSTTASGTFANGTQTTTATTDASGVATASAYTANSIAGTYTVSATAGSASAAFSLTNAAGSLSKVVWTTQPSNATAGASISPSPAVQLQDQYGNPVTSADTVALSIVSGPNGASISAGATTTAAGSVATFTGLKFNTAGTYTVKATDGSTSSANSSTFTISVGTVSQLAWGQQPTGATAGAALSPAPTVLLEDQYGNVANSSDTVTLSVVTGPTGATISSGGSATASAGTATFSALKFNTAGTYTIKATDGSVTSATSNSFNVSAAAANKLAFGQQPTSATAGAAISPAPTVQILDQFGNLTSSTANVTVVLGANPGSGTLSGTATVAAVNGAATFSGLSINKAATGYTLTASSGTLTGATSSSFNITASTPATLTYQTPPPSSVSKNTSFTVAVKVVDQYGNPISGATVTFTGTRVSGQGSYNGTATVTTDSSGVATNTGAKFSNTGTFTLTATSGTASVTSGNIIVN